MAQGSFHWLLKLALAGVCLPAIVRSEDLEVLPRRLADTGLYVAGGTTIRPDVLPFSPQYPLWSDGAAKRRWIWLPPGTTIDAAQPDAWDFPRGTKLWKEFTHGRALETRYIERAADGSWRFGSYVWNADGTDAVLAPASGLRDLPTSRSAGDTRGSPAAHYTIPSVDDCRACHEGAPVPVLGFSALQLSPDRDPLAPHADPTRGIDLRALVARGLLRNLPPGLLANPPRIVAANPAERAALGYLHGNCGNCHNDEGPLAVLDLTLAQRVARPSPVLESIVGVRSQFVPPGVPPDALRLAPGHSAASVITARMGSRDPLQQMPPLGTTAVDTEALTLVAHWIQGFPSHSSN
jgi:mono/diheme cytochrome c family protein